MGIELPFIGWMFQGTQQLAKRQGGDAKPKTAVMTRNSDHATRAFTSADLAQSLSEDQRKRSAGRSALRRLPETGDVARMVGYLLGEDGPQHRRQHMDHRRRKHRLNCLYPGRRFQIAVIDEIILDFPPSVAPCRVWASGEQYGRYWSHLT
jgi:hypothetical protein